MREVRIDFTKNEYLPDGRDIGRIGEHNATNLVITPPQEMTDCAGIQSLIAVFAGDGKLFRTEQYPKEAQITVPLCSPLTQSHSLSFQLEGYGSDGNLIVKSPLITGLRLLPSADGDEADFESSDSGLIAEISANTLARHTHENADVLGKFGENNGVPTYDGQPIASRKTKTAVYDLLDGESYAFVEATGMRKALLFVINEMTANPIAEGTEILSVEMHFSSDSIPGWVSVDNMNAFDPMTPHIVNHGTAFYESSIGYMCVAALFFPTSDSLFYNAFQSDNLDKIRVTFAESDEAVG